MPRGERHLQPRVHTPTDIRDAIWLWHRPVAERFKDRLPTAFAPRSGISRVRLSRVRWVDAISSPMHHACRCACPMLGSRRCGMSVDRPPFVCADEFVRPDLPWATELAVQQFLKFTAIGYQEFRAECELRDPSEPYLALYAYNPLEARPIVETRRSGYVLPIPRT